MSTIVTRSGKGAALTHTEVDANFTNLNADKAEASAVIPATEKGAASGVCPLDAASKVASTYLPSYVDDVLEYANLAALPVTGETGKIYVALDTNKTYRWSGSAYIYITSGAVDSVAGKTGVVTLDKADVGLSNVSNTAQVTSVTGTSPIISSGGVTPSISISAATTTDAGSMSAADKAKIDAVTGTNTGDETASTIKTKLGITTLSGSNTGDQTIALTGDITGSGSGSFVTTLATITDSGTGTFKKITTNSKGLVTGSVAVAQADITGLLGAGSISNTMLANSAVANLSGTNTGDQVIPVASSTTPADLGTAAVGTGTTFARADHVHQSPTTVSGNAGTATSIAGGVANNIPYQTAANTTAFIPVSTAAGQVLTTVAAGGAPTWSTSSSLLGQTNSGSPFETALGYQAGNVNTGVNNTFIGFRAGVVNTTSTDNTAVGSYTLFSNTTGQQNSAMGSLALYSNTTGQQNSAIGYYALYSNTTGSYNAAVGSSALSANTTGSFNVAQGYRALSSNTTGQQNTAQGTSALQQNTTGSYNTAVGYQALYFNTTGAYNTAVGLQALFSNTTGEQNIAQGYYALYSNTTGSYNTAVGYNALYSNTVGVGSTAQGYRALYANTTGGSNTAVGYAAGYGGGTNANTTGTNNIFLGYQAVGASATASNVITLGNSSIAMLRCQVTTITAISDARDKTDIAELGAGLDFVNALAPVSFTWNMRDGGKVGEPDTGFIAQGLVQAQEDTGHYIPGLVYDENPERLEAGYGKLIPVLVKAIQELSAEVSALKSQLNGANNG